MPLFHTGPNGLPRLNSAEFCRRHARFADPIARQRAILRFAHAHGMAL